MDILSEGCPEGVMSKMGYGGISRTNLYVGFLTGIPVQLDVESDNLLYIAM